MKKPGILLVGSFLSSLVITRSVCEELSERLSARGWNTIETSHKSGRLMRLIDMLFSTILHRKKYQVAYVEVYSGTAFLWAEMVCSLLDLLRKPYVLTLHGGNLPVFTQRWHWRVKPLLQRARAVTSPSNYLQERMCIYRSEILLIPNPLHIKDYPFRHRSLLRPRLIWLRAFHDIYNPQMAVDVLAELRKSFPDTQLIMIGPEKSDRSLAALYPIIEKLDLSNNIQLIPGIPKSDVPEYLMQADIFINTTNVDNTPVSVIEAMACGLCVVSTNVGGIPYLLDHEETALLVPPNDSESMAAAVNRVLNEPDLAHRLSQNARKKVEQFDWSAILPQWETLFADVIARG
jgi:glycosyltransferase involved in cell wall biosynthesis